MTQIARAAQVSLGERTDKCNVALSLKQEGRADTAAARVDRNLAVNEINLAQALSVEDSPVR